MTRPEERLAELLHDTTPEPVRDLSYDAVVDRVRARRRNTRALAVGGTAIVAVLAVLAVVGAPALSGSRAPASGPGPTVTATSSPIPPKGTIDFQGVRVTVPAGWTVGELPLCGLGPDRYVGIERSVRFYPQCPYRSAPAVTPRTLILTRVFSWASTSGYNGGAPTEWHGQPAFIEGGSSKGRALVTLVLPWLNVGVSASAPSHAEAMALLDSVVPQPASSLAVPAGADAVEVVWQPVTTSGELLRAHVTRAADVAALLADLRAGARVTPSAMCDAAEAGARAVLTVRSGAEFQTFAASFGGCAQLTNGRGHAVQATRSLRADVTRLARHVTQYQNPSGGCEIAGGPEATNGHGTASKVAALQGFLSGHPVGFPRDVSAYTEVADGIFLSDHTEVAVAKLLPPGFGYAVQLTSDCGWYY